MKITTFGYLANGGEAKSFCLENANGTIVKVTNFGVNIISIIFNGKDMALGYDDITGYEDNRPMLGATVGRNVNRISNARFEIDKKEYRLIKNRGKHNIHSDKDKGFHKVLWQYDVIGENAVKFTYLSPDGEQGFPGNLNVSILYELTDDDELSISYEALSDKKTLINMTNHNYFNLNGHNGGSIADTKVKIYADAFTPVDADIIPTGEIRSVSQTAMDFRQWKKIGDGLKQEEAQFLFTNGYDHNFALQNQNAGVRKVAEALCEQSRVKMEVYTDLPGLQFYTGNSLKEPNGKNNTSYKKLDGFCMEPQFYPNAINTEGFEKPLFDKGEKYKAKTVYKFLKV